jgi:hypothetical protein
MLRRCRSAHFDSARSSMDPVRRAGDALVQPSDATAASRVVATTDYFAALGQPIVEGRPFTTFDRAEGESVAIVSRTLARALWGDVSASEGVSRHFR